VLEGVISKGTARRADIGRPAAGKTGTSQNWENAWFVGYTPTLSTAVWMGHPNANIGMANVHGVAHVTGGTLPAMMWHDFMVEAVKDVPPVPFAQPGQLPSVAKKEAKARQLEEERRQQRAGIEIPELQTAQELMSPEGPWWTPAPLPHAKAPPKAKPAPTEGTSPSTSPPPNSPPPKSKPESSTTTTTRPPPREEPLPLPIPRR
jgi:penicillin-binding protein 1A